MPSFEAPVLPANAPIDLRSDTVTRPSVASRVAMASAEVGDDVIGDDLTVRRLEEEAAALVRKEAACWVPSGTMGNLCSVLAHCHERGAEVLVGDRAHIFKYEAGGASVLGGVAYHTIPNNEAGELPLDLLRAALRPDDCHYARTSLVCLESTQNQCGGRVLALAYLRAVQAWAASVGLPVHLDGARVFNAAAALGVPVGDIADTVTTVQFCLSKALGAPAGSIVAGPAPFVARVRRLRKMVGGGMRQVGILAAAGLVALQGGSPYESLREDHRKAAAMADILTRKHGLEVVPVESNIVVVSLAGHGERNGEWLQARLAEHNVLCFQFAAGVRLVTHCDVTHEQCVEAAELVGALLRGDGGAPKSLANGHSLPADVAAQHPAKVVKTAY